jgi:hypothetical protein
MWVSVGYVVLYAISTDVAFWLALPFALSGFAALAETFTGGETED